MLIGLLVAVAGLTLPASAALAAGDSAPNATGSCSWYSSGDIYPAPSGLGPGSGPVSDGHVTISHLWVQTPGGTWQPGSSLCVVLTYTPETSQPSPGGPPAINPSQEDVQLLGANGEQDLSSTYPAGTLISATLTSSGPAPDEVIGAAIADPVTSLSGKTVEVQGTTGPIELPSGYDRQGNPNCQNGRDETWWDFSVQFAHEHPQPGVTYFEPVGVSLSSNALSFDGPYVQPDGSVMTTLTGCGAGGFFRGFIPFTYMATQGVSAATFAALPTQAVAGLVSLTNNGQPAPSALLAATASAPATQATGDQPASAAGPAGLTIDYHLHYSSHRLLIKINHQRALAYAQLVKSCRRRHGRLRYRRGHKLVCVG